MDEDKLRIVRVYIKKYKSKDADGNPIYKESKQKQVSLKKDDPFEDNDKVVVLSKEEFEKIKSYEDSEDYQSQIENLNKELSKKEMDLSISNEKLESLKVSSEDTIYKLKEDLLKSKDELIFSKNKIQELQDKLSQVEEERADIFKELDYKNKMILSYNIEINQSVLKAINMVIDEAKESVNRRNLEIANSINKSINKAKIEVNEKNKAIAFEINSTVDALNEEIRHTSMIKMLLNKNKINLVVPTGDLMKPFEFDFDAAKFLKSGLLEIDASEIIKQVMPKLPEPFSKYIAIEEDTTKTIDVKERSKKED